MIKILALLSAFVSATVFAAQAEAPAFNPSQLKRTGSAKPNEVLVLGTPHFSTLPAGFQARYLQTLISRLQAWQPGIITIEALSGTQCDYMRRYSARYADAVKSYCWDTTAAHKATGLDVPEATAEMARLLAAWPAAPSVDQRRSLAAVFLAAGEPVSALVQWLKLPAAERRAGNGLNQILTEKLQGLAEKRNENTLLAAPLAVRLGLERVYAIDDHTADSVSADEADNKAAGDIMQRLWDNPATASRLKQDQALESRLDSEEGVLNMYRVLNRPDQAMLVYRSDFGAALKDQSARQYGRTYVAYWETRNLRMVSNIREILDPLPGQRVLSIVGASHKGYVEAYLHMMHDVKIKSVAAVLR